jgi:hypothetical protein
LCKARMENDMGFLKECVCSLLALMELEVEQWPEPVPMGNPRAHRAPQRLPQKKLGYTGVHGGTGGAPG